MSESQPLQNLPYVYIYIRKSSSTLKPFSHFITYYLTTARTPLRLHWDVVGVGFHWDLHLGDFRNEHFGGEHQSSNGCGVLQGVDGHLSGIQHTGGQEIFVNVGGGVVPEAERLVSALIGNNLHRVTIMGVSNYPK